MTDAEWHQFQITQRDRMLAIRWAEIEKLKTRSSFWHGKWAIVCHENNVLRKKIRELKATDEESESNSKGTE